MGKKRAGVRGSPTQTQALVVAEEPASPETKKFGEEGALLFGRKEYVKALEAYDKALKAVTVDSSADDRALLHSNKAACFMMQQKFKEAVNECSSALELNPGFHRALVRRAKANEQLGFYKKALQDVQKANKAEPANPDTQEAEKRLKDIVHGNRKGTVAGMNGSSKKPGIMQGGQRGNRLMVMAKCDLNGEVRLVPLMGQLTYAEVLDAVQEKFPQAGPFYLKYLDREGDLVTITDKTDVHKAVAELVEQADRKAGSHSPRLSQPQLPPLQLKLTPVDSKDQVPQPPPDELAALAELQAARKLFQAQALAESRKRMQQAEAVAEQHQQEQQPGPELDQWLVDFAGLFRDHLGVEPDRHLDLTQHGWDSLQAAIDAAVQDEKSLPLFQKAFDKFQEVSASGQIQMGNVKLALGKRLMDRAIGAGNLPSSAKEEVEEQYSAAEVCYHRAQELKADMYDPIISLANLEFERGKLAMDLSIASPSQVTQEQKDADPEAEKKAQNTHLTQVKAGLAKLTAENVDAAMPYYQRTWELVQKALDTIPQDLHNIKLKPPPPEGQPPEEDMNPWGHCMVVWGNLLYEQSQFQAAVGKEWKPSLDSAVEKFRAAGCPENEIRGALQAHTMKDELDLGPDPAEAEKEKEKAEQEKKAAEDKAAADKAEEPAAPKGLPDLGKPKKKKAAAMPASSEASTDTAA